MEKWIEESLGNLIIEEKKSSIQVQGASKSGDYPFFTSGDNVLFHDEYLVDGEKLFLATGGKANIKFYNGKAAYSTDTYVISNECSSTAYLYYYLLNQLDFINSNLFTGSGLKHLQKNDFKKLKLKLPKDKEERTRIAQILSKADSAIAQTEALIAKCHLIKTGLMQDLLTKGIDEKGNIRSEKTHSFKTEKGLRVPKEWEVVKLSELISIKHGFAFKGEFFTDAPNDKILLTPGNFSIRGGLYFTPKNTKYYLGDYPAEYELKNGDVLVVMTDLTKEMAILGNTVVLKSNSSVLHNQRIGKIIIKKGIKLDKEFITLILNSEAVKKIVKETATGTTVRHTSPTKICDAFVPYISNNEQNFILEKIHCINHYIEASSYNLIKLQSIKTGLMQDLLSGKVRVKTKDN